MTERNTGANHRRKKYQELTFTDDFMFRKVLRNDEKLCMELVELLLDVSIDHIVYKDDEHTIATTSDSKGIRLDVYLKDEDGTVFDLEMQNNPSENLPKRARYYQSMIDTSNLFTGQEYEDLPDSYILFICTFDPCGAGLPKYEFTEVCTEDSSIVLNSGTRKVFINANGKREKISLEMKAFLDYLCGKGVSSTLTRDIETSVVRAKAIKPWEMEYMFFEDKLRRERKEGLAEGRAEGIVEGANNARLEDIQKLVAAGICDEKKACEILGVSPDEYKEFADSQIN